MDAPFGRIEPGRAIPTAIGSGAAWQADFRPVFPNLRRRGLEAVCWSRLGGGRRGTGAGVTSPAKEGTPRAASADRRRVEKLAAKKVLRLSS